MKKLLVAIDFSPASRAAFEYAAWMASKLNASLSAIHVAPSFVTSETLDEAISIKAEEKEDAQLLDKLNHFTTFYPGLDATQVATNIRTKLIVKRGNPSTEIIKTAKVEKADVILIGTKARHTLWQQLFGSLTTALLREALRSILIIPEGNQLKEVKNIAFASAINLDEEAVMPAFYDLAENLGAGIHPFHINAQKKERFKLKEELLATGLDSKEVPPIVTLIREKSVIDGIAYFLEKYPVEILALYTPHRAFFEQIFHRSLSKQIAYSTRIPLLVCKGESVPSR